MEFIAIIKRVVPFLLTFVAGLAVASFFVTLTVPSFKWASKRAYQGEHKCRKFAEFNRLREENLRLKMELEQKRFAAEMNFDVPPVPPAPPAPLREMKMKSVEVR